MLFFGGCRTEEKALSGECVLPGKIMLWSEARKISSYIRPYLLDTSDPRGAVLIIPGGGYHMVCEPSEGAPVARGFNALGYHAFVLNYRVYPDVYPAPQQDALRAMKIIRGRAKEWKILPDKIGVCGFSAGGHLASTLGSDLAAGVEAVNGDEFDAVAPAPDFIICGQGVLTFAGDRNQNSSRCWLGKDAALEKVLAFSPEKHVTPETPPVFLWTTFADKVVDYSSSVIFAEALRECGVPCELHIFARGDHGVLLGMDTPDVSQWQSLAVKFIEAQTAKDPVPEENYTHLHQCEATGTFPGAWEDKPRDR